MACSASTDLPIAVPIMLILATLIAGSAVSSALAILLGGAPAG
jgi:hypothetical protein